MPDEASFDLHRRVQARHAAMIDQWYRAIAWTGFSTMAGDDMRHRLGIWLDQIGDLLADKTIDRAQAQAIGSRLAQLHMKRGPRPWVVRSTSWRSNSSTGRRQRLGAIASGFFSLIDRHAKHIARSLFRRRTKRFK